MVFPPVLIGMAAFLLVFAAITVLGYFLTTRPRGDYAKTRFRIQKLSRKSPSALEWSWNMGWPITALLKLFQRKDASGQTKGMEFRTKLMHGVRTSQRCRFFSRGEISSDSRSRACRGCGLFLARSESLGSTSDPQQSSTPCPRLGKNNSLVIARLQCRTNRPIDLVVSAGAKEAALTAERSAGHAGHVGLERRGWSDPECRHPARHR